MIEEHTLSVLDFFKVVKHLKTYSRFAEGAESIDLIRPATDYETAKSNLAKTAETIKALSMTSGLWQRELPPMGAILKRLGKINGILTAREVVVFLVFFPVVDTLRRVFSSRRDDYPLWSRRFESVIDFSRLAKEVENLVDTRGRIKDSASVKLARIRRQLASTRIRVKDALNSYLQSSKLTEVIAERIITQRNGRYVIPAVKGKENVLRGIVQDTSKSGATVFIEPERIFPLNNLLISLAAEEEEEIAYLLARISDLLRHQVRELKQAVAVLAEFDSFYARACLAEALTAVAPVLNQRGLIDIREGRHPVLILNKGNEAVVPQSIKIGGGYHTLVITGPNTGGKTVALKTVGLLTLMALCGMYIPARENSGIAFYHKIYADIGDEQSLEQSLSTFSAHMTNVVHMLKGAQDDALYLLDELGAGTDPTEGAALAVSIIETLHKKRATTIVATHFRLLKNFAADKPDMENASVEFNEKDLLPTYKLRMGFLGSSRAIVTAKRLGLPEEIVAQAEALVTGPEFQLDQLLVKLENETREQAVKVRDISDKERKINRLYQEWQEKNSSLKEFAVAKRRQALRETRQLVASARQEIAALLSEARKAEKAAEVESVRRNISRREADLNAELKRLEQPLAVKHNHKVSDFQIGEIVYIENLHLSGKVISRHPDKGTLRIECGEKIIEVASLEVIKNDKPLTATLKNIGFHLAPPVEVSMELNLIGMRADEAGAAVEQYLDRALLSHFSRAFIIHGVGGGVLRKIVAEILGKHPRVKSYRSGTANEGGVGVTIVEFDV